jgi:hypothetical protein
MEGGRPWPVLMTWGREEGSVGIWGGESNHVTVGCCVIALEVPFLTHTGGCPYENEATRAELLGGQGNGFQWGSVCACTLSLTS